MKWGWRTTCVKYSLLLVNLFLFCFGIVLFALGIFSLSVGFIGAELDIPPLGIGILIMGLALSIISFFGCCGAGKENRVLLAVYFIFVVLILICQVGIGIAGLVVDSRLPEITEKAWNSSTPKVRGEIQFSLDCCGYKDSTEPGYNITSCPVNSEGQVPTMGCKEAILNFVSRVKHAMTAAIVFAFLQIVGLVLAFLFFKSIQKKTVDRRDLLAESRRINNFYKARK